MMDAPEHLSAATFGPFVNSPRNSIVGSLAALVTFVILYAMMLYNYILFHSVAELFSIIVAAGIFMFTWNSRTFLDNSYLLVVGMAYLFVGVLDLLHFMTYEGVGIVPGAALNHSIQFWIAARALESVSLFVPIFVVGRHIQRPVYIFMGYLAVTALLITAIYGWEVFPDCFRAGEGQTAFKIGSEYVIVVILAAALAMLYRHRTQFAPSVFMLLAGSVGITMIAEIVLTLWRDPFDIFSAIGHFLKIVSFYLIYRAIIVTGIEEPFNVVFRNLKQSEREKERLVNDLRHALNEVKTLSGFIPICARCKKIRDDEGYWQQVEEYISHHSNAEFSHSICPECMAELYPGYDTDDSSA